MGDAPIERTPPNALPARVLPSGRQVVVDASAQGERIEVRAPDGSLEIAIALTPEGPVLQVRGARLEIDSTDAVALRCKEFALHAEQGISLTSGGRAEVRAQGEVAITSMADARLDAAVIHLNGGDRSAYPDGQPGYVPPTIDLPPPIPPIHDPHAAQAQGSCGCDHTHPGHGQP